MARLKGIVFDLDGTLINSNVNFPKMKQNMIRVLEENGAPRDFLNPQMTTVVIMENAERFWSEQCKTEEEKRWLRDEITRIMNQGELDAIETLTPIQGVKEVVQTLKKRGFKLAVLTRSHHEYAVHALKKTGMLEDFDVVLGRAETPKPKPYAEAMTATAEKLGLNIKEVVLIGDDHIDSTCAINAKCAFLGVATGSRGDKSWEINKPAIILPNITYLLGWIEENPEI